VLASMASVSIGYGIPKSMSGAADKAVTLPEIF
jgi:hypothetical protein